MNESTNSDPDGKIHDAALALAAADPPAPQDERPAAPADVSAAAAVVPAAALDQVQASLGELGQRLDRLETALENLAKQTALLPPQVRAMGTKVEALATSVAEPRYRDVLMGLLAAYDVVERILRTLPAAEGDAEAGHRRNYEALLAHLRQVLAVNGLSEISAAGAFDPAVHRAVQTAAVSDPARHNQVLEVIRPGFRTEHAVLRYAEVVVGRASQ